MHKDPYQVDGVKDLYFSNSCTPWIGQVAVVIIYW